MQYFEEELIKEIKKLNENLQRIEQAVLKLRGI